MTSQQLDDLQEMTGQPRIPMGTRFNNGGVLDDKTLATMAPYLKKSKYKAVRTIDADGTRWDSKAERRRWDVLVLMRDQGLIQDLRRQPRFDITMNGIFCGFYKSDFEYYRGKERVIEDVKGFRTQIFKLKKKLVEAQYSITITEII